ncbi:MAG: CHAP domain-containing protein [Oscillospiraceae bacterium]|nr:CHAP domain-containing protein [Oscillospiraceae bacterium]
MKHERLLGLALSGLMLFSVPLYVPAEKIMPDLMITANAANLSLAELQNKFPDGKYWNHAGNPGSSNSVNNQDGYTSTPCSKHGVVGTSKQTCNGFCPSGTQLSWQCMGFAEKLGYDSTGYNPRNNANGWQTYTNSSALDNLKAGDIVRYKNDGHSIFVTAVDGDTVTYADCNSDGHCIIRWNKTISKATLRSTFTHLRSSPGIVFPSLEVDHNWQVPVQITATKKMDVYNSDGSVQSGRWIDSGDNCYIDEVYTNGLVHVEYPSGNSRRWAYARREDFNLEPIQKQPESHNPVLWIDGIEGEEGRIHIHGWAYDEDDRNASLDIHVYMDNDNKWVGATTCNIADEEPLRNVVGQASNYYHRFDATFMTSERGNHRINVAALDNAGGNATWDGRDVTISDDVVTAIPV